MFFKTLRLTLKIYINYKFPPHDFVNVQYDKIEKILSLVLEYLVICTPRIFKCYFL